MTAGGSSLALLPMVLGTLALGVVGEGVSALGIVVDVVGGIFLVDPIADSDLVFSELGGSPGGPEEEHMFVNLVRTASATRYSNRVEWSRKE